MADHLLTILIMSIFNNYDSFKMLKIPITYINNKTDGFSHIYNETNASICQISL